MDLLGKKKLSRLWFSGRVLHSVLVSRENAVFRTDSSTVSIQLCSCSDEESNLHKTNAIRALLALHVGRASPR